MSESEKTATPAEQTQADAPKPQRVLACVLCQQRKIKCDRKFPCANCVRNGAQCVPANTLAPRQRRRRFPERELLERLHHYEDLLRQNNIRFVPLHPSATGKTSSNQHSSGHNSDPMPSESQPGVGDKQPGEVNMAKTKAVNIWHAMNQKETPEIDNNSNHEDEDEDEEDDRNSSHGEVRHVAVKKALDHLFEKGDDQLLFGARKLDIDLSTLHPQQVHIFRLWQIYLDNVNPLLKVTHTPTLQTRIIDAVGNLGSISPALEALMFSIYCISTLSLSEDESRSLFAVEKKDLLASYQFSCQQALLKCGILRTSDRDCLTALLLYLISVKPGTDPQSLSAMLGTAIRIAQAMGLHNESANSKHTALEAEMRRRLWWALVIFDARVSDMSNSVSMLAPIWDCRTPSNVNDFDLRPEMKAPPTDHGNPTEATFAVVRSEMANFVRYRSYYLDFVNPALKPLVKDAQRSLTLEGDELSSLEKVIEDKYVKFCNPENPLHFMIIWTARGFLARHRHLNHYSKYSGSSVQQTDAQRDAAVSYALSMFECDTKLLTSPLTKGFFWHNTGQFPFQAYVHIVQDLRKRPFGKHAEKAWQVMSDNYKVRFMDTSHHQGENPLSKIISKNVFQAWEARSAASSGSAELEPPLIVTAMRQKATPKAPSSQYGGMEQVRDVPDMHGNDITMHVPMDFDGHSQSYSFGLSEWTHPQHVDVYTGPEQPTMEIGMNQLNLTLMDWSSEHQQGW